MLQHLTRIKPVLSKEGVRLLSNGRQYLHSVCQMLALLSDNQANAFLVNACILEANRMWEQRIPACFTVPGKLKPRLRELVLCLHMRPCSGLLLPCGIIREQDSLCHTWGKASSLRLSQLAAGMSFLDPKLGPSAAVDTNRRWLWQFPSCFSSASCIY